MNTLHSDRLARRRRIDKGFRILCWVMAWTSVVLLAILLFDVIAEGHDWVDWQFLQSFSSRHAEKAGIKAAIAGSLAGADRARRDRNHRHRILERAIARSADCGRRALGFDRIRRRARAVVCRR